MIKKDIMWELLNEIYTRGLMTKFIVNLFNYENFNDYNYLFRMKEKGKKILIDIYDNVSNNRFNRYVFTFSRGRYDVKVKQEGNVFVSYIYIFNIDDGNNKLFKFAHLFRLRKNRMIEYARSFLDEEFVLILERIIKKPIS